MLCQYFSSNDLNYFNPFLWWKCWNCPCLLLKSPMTKAGWVTFFATIQPNSNDSWWRQTHQMLCDSYLFCTFPFKVSVNFFQIPRVENVLVLHLRFYFFNSRKTHQKMSIQTRNKKLQMSVRHRLQILFLKLIEYRRND